MKSLPNDIIIDGKSIGLPSIMKKLNFVADLDTYTRKFTRFYVEDNKLFIGHTISAHKTLIDVKDINEWLEYFDRI